jgi:hypothetical protein
MDTEMSNDEIKGGDVMPDKAGTDEECSVESHHERLAAHDELHKSHHERLLALEGGMSDTNEEDDGEGRREREKLETRRKREETAKMRKRH